MRANVPWLTRLRALALVPMGALAIACSGAQASASADAGGVADAPVDAPSSDSKQDAGPQAPAVIPLSGCGPFYTAAVTLGGSQTFHLAVDTGSTTTVVAAVGCTSCKAAGVGALYNPAAATNLSKSAMGVYDDGDITWTGSLYEDSVSVAASLEAVPVKIAAVAKEQGFFFNACEDAPTDIPEGILGLGTDDLLAPGTNGYLDQLLSAHEWNDVFAVHMCHRGGTLWLGGYDASAATGPVQFTSLTQKEGYEVTVAGFAVGTASMPLSAPAPAILDTGGYNLFVPSGAYTAVVAAIASDSNFKQQFGDASWFMTMSPTKLTVAPADMDAKLPPLTIHLGADASITLQLPASSSYLHWFADPAGGYDYVPALFANSIFSGNQGIDIGDVLMQTNIVVFDRANHQVGFAPTTACPN